MNLIVDIGNSTTKVALSDAGKILDSGRHESLSEEFLAKFLGNRRIERAILSSVKGISDDIIGIVRSRSEHVHLLTHKSSLPFRIDYLTPETLGQDRIAAVAGAFSLKGESDSLVIDAGTAITFDYLEGFVYRGGNISPGIDTRFRALNHFTGRLPLVSRAERYSNPGKSTGDAIRAGVISGVVFEINEYIRTFEQNSKGPNVFLTGGDGGFLDGLITGKHVYVPDLVMNGLNYILDYNA